MNILRVVGVVVVVAGSANDTVALSGGLLREYCNRSWIGTLSVDVSMVVVVYDSFAGGGGACWQKPINRSRGQGVFSLLSHFDVNHTCSVKVNLLSPC
jgi:hypothetical protein